MWEKIANFQLFLPSQYKIDQKTPTKSETPLFHYNLLNSRLKQDPIQRDRKIIMKNLDKVPKNTVLFYTSLRWETKEKI